jgi:hypothetical protein
MQTDFNSWNETVSKMEASMLWARTLHVLKVTYLVCILSSFFASCGFLKAESVFILLREQKEYRKHWILLIYLILPAGLGPGVYSASNRNEYQKHKNNVSGE